MLDVDVDVVSADDPLPEFEYAALIPASAQLDFGDRCQRLVDQQRRPKFRSKLVQAEPRGIRFPNQ